MDRDGGRVVGGWKREAYLVINVLIAGKGWFEEELCVVVVSTRIWKKAVVGFVCTNLRS